MNDLLKTIGSILWWGFVVLLVTDNLHIVKDFVEVHIESVAIENEVKLSESDVAIELSDEERRIIGDEILRLENKAIELDKRVDVLLEQKEDDNWVVHRDAVTGYVLTKHLKVNGGCPADCRYRENK